MKVTVIVATYGDPKWRQTAERAVASAEAERPVKVIQPHGYTLHGARNRGAAQAQTEWLCFLDADDELEPGYLDAMTRATSDLRAPAVRYVEPDKPIPSPRVLSSPNLIAGNYLVIGTLVPKALFDKVGGFRDWPFYEDWDLWQRCWLAGGSVSVVPDAVYRAHVRPDSRNRTPSPEELEAMACRIRETNLAEVAS